ncbi:MAG: STAS domain-containing protein [Bacteroidales bacterium]|nr:STAS domain-containing protein [Bacteroidales bacterium]
MNSKIVRLNEFFDRSISTRSAIENLFNFDKTGFNEIVLDFTDIYLISASASHQIILETRKLEKSGIPVNLFNLDSNVRWMLELSKTDRKNILTVQNIEHYNIQSSVDLNKLLLSN